MSRGGLTGTRIRERRMVLGLRQAEVARDVGISPSYLNLIEHNRRRIGGKLLVDLARKLDVEASILTEGAEAALLEALREASAGPAGAKVETQQVEEFAGRFPGWAQLLADRHRRVGELEQIVEVLSDRMTHDPFLSASLHEVLSTVTAIRSTAAILAETEDIDRDWQARFHRNLRDDSRRLAEGAQALVGYLDDGAGEAGRQTSPQEEVEALLKSQGYHLQELEGDGGDIDGLIAQSGEITSSPGQELARQYLERYRNDARILPLDAFAEAVADLNMDPGRLAQRFGTDAGTVFRRMATLPEEMCPVPVGLVACDGSGTLTFRKPVAGFGLPRFGAACPLWPLYQALTRPMTPIRAVVEQAGQPPERFLTYALCQPVLNGAFGGPQVLEAAMLILPGPPDSEAGVQPIGTSCRICPRRECPARREPSILADGL
ncbi:helix-turn-helix transcriptional regulator [Actibacterium lipolyticum]|uniref:Helix-turn-helix protein n=1 Tax=Actibacterium lipolyticum TaxID=1524263 RepID=A0A238KJN5_9RHOB|nr:helix-turn-helix transcriptional regulator [Actibacterium lipolyticum]SMX43003.1 helix-turn-helix protein [Actibacterium lipolyticum]